MSNLLTTFYLVRHGESEWNVSRKVQGHQDIPLTANGEQQARTLALELKDVDFDEVFSSDLVRAKRTAEIIALEKNLAVTTTERLRERSFGKIEGMAGDDFLTMYADWEKLSDEERWNHKIADEETHREAVTRLIAFLHETAVAYPGKTILIVCHGGLMRSLLIKLGYGSWDTIGGFDNCGFLNIQSDGIEFFLKAAKGIKNWQDIVVQSK